MQDILTYAAILYAVTYTFYHTVRTFNSGRLKAGTEGIYGDTGEFTAGTGAICGNAGGPATGPGRFTAGPGTISGNTGRFTAGYCASCAGCAFNKK